jgi:hypothetical protein
MSGGAYLDRDWNETYVDRVGQRNMRPSLERSLRKTLRVNWDRMAGKDVMYNNWYFEC